jgi:class 3 adenylate cyclase
MLSPAVHETTVRRPAAVHLHPARPPEVEMVDKRPRRVVPGGHAERKFATVLFIDIRGSMDLSGSRKPEEWWSTIDELFELMCEGVYRFGGWVAGFTGDSISAIFESPPASQDHAKQACDAALWLRDAIDALALQLRQVWGFELGVRLGINSGDIVVGTIGNRYRRYHTAAGYSVALAQRMEAIAEVGHIYLTEATVRLIDRHVAVRSLGALAVKGARTPVEVFELVGTVPGVTVLTSRLACRSDKSPGPVARATSVRVALGHRQGARWMAAPDLRLLRGPRVRTKVGDVERTRFPGGVSDRRHVVLRFGFGGRPRPLGGRVTAGCRFVSDVPDRARPKLIWQPAGPKEIRCIPSSTASSPARWPPTRSDRAWPLSGRLLSDGRGAVDGPAAW